jgi:trehalose 6-phosphate synthase
MVSKTNPVSQPRVRLPKTRGRLLLVSNRGPVEHCIDDAGRIRRHDAGGGVAVALANVARNEPVTWIAAAGSFADRVVAQAGDPIRLSPDSDLRLIDLPNAAYDAHYYTFCNPILWFVQHSLHHELEGRDLAVEAAESWQTGYKPVNQLFADAVIQELEDEGRVMLHDYHLYLAPRLVRHAKPHATLQQFIHIPWPAPQAWLSLPSWLVSDICDGILANDSIGFQTDASVDNFMATCRAFLGSKVDVWERQGEVRYLGQTSTVWSNPISVDLHELRELAASAAVRRYKEEIATAETMKTIVRVDRLDPSKNILRGFQAYERLLERVPDLRGRVRFIAYLVPSRTGIPEYDCYAAQVFGLVQRINERFGTGDWQPLTVYHEQNRERAIAGLTAYDVLLVNSVADGMNLVSKEGPAVNERAGVLVLSLAAGSCQELDRGALCVDPFDVEGTAQALQEALRLPPEERERRASQLQRDIGQYELRDWLRHQLNDLAIAEYVKGLEPPPLA